jgi:hypothetical protein
MKNTTLAISLVLLAAVASCGERNANATQQTRKMASTYVDYRTHVVGVSQLDLSQTRTLPVLPTQGISIVTSDTVLTIPSVRLSALTVTLDGQPLAMTTDSARGYYDITVPAASVGNKISSLLLHERLAADGSTVVVPFTLFGTDPAHAMLVIKVPTPTPTHPRTVAQFAIGPSGSAASTSFVAGAGSDGQMETPMSIAAAPSGELLLLDQANSRVLAISRQGGTSRVYANVSPSVSDLIADPASPQTWAIDTIQRKMTVLETGASVALPALVGLLPGNSQYMLSIDHTLFVKNTADGVWYSLGTVDPTTSAVVSTGDLMRDVAAGRDVIVNNSLMVQAQLDAAPVSIQFPGTLRLEIIDSIETPDATHHVLIGVLGDNNIESLQMVAVNGQQVTTASLSIDGRMAATRNLAYDGTSVVLFSSSSSALTIQQVQP